MDIYGDDGLDVLFSTVVPCLFGDFLIWIIIFCLSPPFMRWCSREPLAYNNSVNETACKGGKLLINCSSVRLRLQGIVSQKG